MRMEMSFAKADDHPLFGSRDLASPLANPAEIQLGPTRGYRSPNGVARDASVSRSKPVHRISQVDSPIRIVSLIYVFRALLNRIAGFLVSADVAREAQHHVMTLR